MSVIEGHLSKNQPGGACTYQRSRNKFLCVSKDIEMFMVTVLDTGTRKFHYRVLQYEP